VLLSIPGVSPESVPAGKAAQSLERLKTSYAEIEKLKADQARQLSEIAIGALGKLRDANDAEFKRVMAQFR
jgi:hypothetical protein